MNTPESTTSVTTNGNLRFVLWMSLAALVIAADQLTKLAIVRWIPLLDSVQLTSFINLTHQKNPGAAFGMFADAGGWQRWFLTILAAGVGVVIVVWIWRIRHAGQAVLATGLSLVLGGAIGNMIDRMLHGHVTDFVQVWFGNWAFPSFNVADAGISVGAALLIIDALFFSGREERATSTD